MSTEIHNGDRDSVSPRTDKRGAGHTPPKPTGSFFSDGIDAFPGPAVGYKGMTLRDWFAGQALCGVMHDRAIWDSGHGEQRDIAERMYQFADAMIAVRAEQS